MRVLSKWHCSWCVDGCKWGNSDDQAEGTVPVVLTMLPDRVLSISLLLLWVVVVGGGRVWVGGRGACVRRVRSDMSD